MRSFKVLWFDLDDTVFDHTYCVCRGLDAIREKYPVFGKGPTEGISLAILTNGDQDIQEEKLRVIGLQWMVPHLMTAQRAGTAKPHPQFYEWALEQTGHDPGTILMVGDSLENDVEAALRCGLNAVLYAPRATQPTVLTRYGVALVMNEWSKLLDFAGDAHARNAGCGKPS